MSRDPSTVVPLEDSSSVCWQCLAKIREMPAVAVDSQSLGWGRASVLQGSERALSRDMK